jgi:hypothetical protein
MTSQPDRRVSQCGQSLRRIHWGRREDSHITGNAVFYAGKKDTDRVFPRENWSLPTLPRQFFESRDQHIDFVFCVVKTQACPDRAVRKPEPFHKRLAAVVA